MASGRRPATEQTAARNRAARDGVDAAAAREMEIATRGLVAGFDPPVIEDAEGRTVWELSSYGFLDGDPPDSANPAQWRQAQLNRVAGLFELAPGIYQLRGFDLSNMHVIEGEEGVIVVDPLVTAESAAAALALYAEHRGERPVTGVIYSHSHVDHFGGARGVVDQEDVDSGRVPVLAPSGFLEHAISENVYAGTAMARRAGYMYGALLGRGPDGQLTSGLGQTTSLGTVTLVPPTVVIEATGQEETVDGVRLRFQMTPEAEAPAAMNFHLPDRRALCVADNAVCSMHNILTLRGAVVRDPRVWARHLDDALELFGADTEVLFAGHNWPRWGQAEAVALLGGQRDLYTYLHDQTLRLLNSGRTGNEIAEELELPPELASEWHCREFYGSLSHNVKAIYQRYMGWFDGNPAHLWEHPPQERSRRYVEFMGGADRALEQAREVVRRRRLPLGRRGRKPPRLRRPRERGRPPAPGRRARAARLRRRERDLAQLLPDGCAGAPRWSLGDADGDRARRLHCPPQRRAAPRRDGDPTQRAAGMGPGAADRLGRHRPRRGALDHGPQRGPTPPSRPPRS